MCLGRGWRSLFVALYVDGVALVRRKPCALVDKRGCGHVNVGWRSDATVEVSYCMSKQTVPGDLVAPIACWEGAIDRMVGLMIYLFKFIAVFFIPLPISYAQNHRYQTPRTQINRDSISMHR